MGWKRQAAFLFSGLIVAACGTRVAPGAQTSPALSPTPRLQSTPSPTPTPQSTPLVASVTCSGEPGAAMAVVGGHFVYDVSDPVHPRLVCRGTNTLVRLVNGNAIVYTTAAADQVVLVRRDLTTGVESKIAGLPSDPRMAFAGWTSDGSLEVYASAGAQSDSGVPVQIHLWSNGADHVLYALTVPVTGFESRWSAPLGIVAFSSDHAYVAVSFPFDFTAQSLRIFSVADRRQLLATGTGFALGGTWIANDRFVWANRQAVMQWTPTEGATLLRSEHWYAPMSSSGGGWLAATLLTDLSKPRVEMVPVAGGRPFVTGLGSSPAFVTPTMVWYAEEGPCPPNDQCYADPTGPDRTVHAFDFTNGSDQVVHFSVGEDPIDNRSNVCCAPGS